VPQWRIFPPRSQRATTADIVALWTSNPMKVLSCIWPLPHSCGSAPAHPARRTNAECCGTDHWASQLRPRSYVPKPDEIGLTSLPSALIQHSPCWPNTDTLGHPHCCRSFRRDVSCMDNNAWPMPIRRSLRAPGPIASNARGSVPRGGSRHEHPHRPIRGLQASWYSGVLAGFASHAHATQPDDSVENLDRS